MDLTTKYNKLIETAAGQYPEDDTFINLISSAVDSYRQYVNHICKMQRDIPVKQVMLDTEDYNYWYVQADKMRRQKHIAAVDSTNKLNRWSKQLSLEPWLEGPTDNYVFDPENGNDRAFIEPYTFQIVSEFYAEAQGMTSMQLLTRGQQISSQTTSNIKRKEILESFNYEGRREPNGMERTLKH